MTAPDLDLLSRLVEETPGAHWVPMQDDRGEVLEFPWVPYGSGFEIPIYFTYDEPGHIEGRPGSFTAKLTVLVIEGRPQCIGLEFWTSLDGPVSPVSPEALHRFPLGRALEKATLMASRPSDEIPRKFKRWKNPDEARSARAAVAAEHRKRPDGHRRPRLTDDFLTEVADVYRHNVATGKPAKAVEKHFHYKPASARRVIHEARRRGFLGPARPGRGGEATKGGENTNG